MTTSPTQADGSPNCREIQGGTNFRELFLGNSPSPRITAGIGVNWNSPFGPFRIDFAQTIRKVEGDDERRFQFTAPVQPGNSGGPVLDMSGNVIGVVVAKLNAMTVQDQYGDIPQNVNFGIALPSLLEFLDENDIAYSRTASSEKLDKVDLAELARASTVLLECYQ